MRVVAGLLSVWMAGHLGGASRQRQRRQPEEEEEEEEEEAIMPARERRGDRRRHAETRRTDNTSRSVSKTITMTSCRCVSVMYLRQQRERERERCRWYEKRHLFAPFLHLKTIKLPRQARDKHRESSTRKREIFAFFRGSYKMCGSASHMGSWST
jgi:hypothetical protein